MTIEKCLPRLTELFKDADPKMLKQIVEELDDVRARTGGVGYPKLANKLKKATAIELKMRAEFLTNNLVARKNIVRRVNGFTDSGLSNQEAFKAIAFGSEKLAKGGNLSIENIRMSKMGRNLNALEKEIGEFMDVAASGKSDIEIARAIEAINNKKSLSDFPPHIQKIAKAVSNTNKLILKDLQDSGIVINNRMDYITRQSHNFEKINDIPGKLSEKKGVWKDKVKTAFDLEESFGTADTAKQDAALDSIFDDIMTGQYEAGVGSIGGKRTLRAKNAEAWAAYNAEFGKGTIIDTTISSVQSAARHTAASTVLGPDFKKNWEWMENKMAEKMDPKEKADFMDNRYLIGKKRQRDALKQNLFGFDERHPGTSLVAKTSQAVIAISSAAKLGSAAINTISDFGFAAQHLKAATGMKSGMAEAQVLKGFMGVMKRSDRDYWAGQMDMYFGDLVSDAMERYGVAGDVGNGLAQRGLKKMMNINGLNWQSTRAKVGFARIFSSELARNATVKFDGLNPRLRAGLERFDIDAKDWEIMSSAKETYRKGIDGITPEGVRQLDDAVFKAAGKNKDELAMKVGTYLSDMAKVGSPEATVLERSLINQGFSPDDPMGALLRTAFLFKSFTLAIPRVMKRIALSNPDLDIKADGAFGAFRKSGSDIKLLAGTMAEVTMLTMAAMTIKDATKNKKRKMDAKFVAEAFTSAAMPLMATYMVDTLKGEYSQYGRSIFKDIAGPALGHVADVADITGSAVNEMVDLLEGKVSMGSKTGRKAVRLIMQLTPGMNLPFVKTILNQSVLSELNEMVSPGYAIRLKMNEMKRGNTSLID